MGSLFPTSFITLYRLTGRDVRLKRTECPDRQRTRTDVVPCSELMPMKQANTTSPFNGSYPSRFCIKNYHFFFFFYAFLPLRAQAFSSGTLPVRALASMRRTEALASVKFYQMLSIFFFSFRYLAFGARATPSGSFASVVVSSWLRPYR